jgi:hypothetical protein
VSELNSNQVDAGTKTRKGSPTASSRTPATERELEALRYRGTPVTRSRPTRDNEDFTAPPTGKSPEALLQNDSKNREHPRKST